jgi:hypothetical protein
MLVRQVDSVHGRRCETPRPEVRAGCLERG